MTIDREQSAATPDVLSDTQRVRVSIARAKFEWETTVDALPDLICLLDSFGRVARVNRVVERWNLGSITGVLGRDLHGLLHGDCAAASCALQVPLTTAVLGGEVDVPTLAGKALRLKIPASTQNGQVFRLKGHGMPAVSGNAQPADLYATVNVELPRSLTPEQRVHFEALQKLEKVS